MKHSLSLLALGLAAMVSSAADAKETWPRWYVGLGGAWSHTQDSDASGLGADIDFESGWGASIALGYYLPVDTGPNLALRTELEGAWRSSDLDSVGGVASSGDYESRAVMLNIYGDFRNSTRWTPYIGAGIGYATVELSGTALGLTDDKDSVLAYQGMAGVSYAPVSIPNTEWRLGYRYFATEDPSYSVGGASVETEYGTHNLEAGVNLRF